MKKELQELKEKAQSLGAIDKVIYENNSVDYYYWISLFAERGL